MICGVGINDMPKGWYSESKWNYLVYLKWMNMIRRCYSKNFQEKRPTYKGCYVCDEWLKLSNFVIDFKLIDGYDDELFLAGKLQLDKDIKSDNNNKCYCLEECMLVSVSENSRQSDKHQNYSYMQGKNNPMYGKCHSKESKQKMSIIKQGGNNPYAKKVAQYDKQGNLIKIWNCMMDVQRKLGIKHSNICDCCRGKRKTAGGYIWKYVEEEE